MKVRIDRGACAGHARCADVASDLFVLDEEGYIAVSELDVLPGREAVARRGAEACPERVLQILTESDPRSS